MSFLMDGEVVLTSQMEGVQILQHVYEQHKRSY